MACNISLGMKGEGREGGEREGREGGEREGRERGEREGRGEIVEEDAEMTAADWKRGRGSRSSSFLFVLSSFTSFQLLTTISKDPSLSLASLPIIRSPSLPPHHVSTDTNKP